MHHQGKDKPKVDTIPPFEDKLPTSKLEMKNYWILVTIRFALAFWPQSGYVHPDEFFQSMEVLAGDVFELDVNRPWEFNNSLPLRSIVLPYAFVGMPYQVLKWCSAFTRFWHGYELLSPYLLLVLPRFVTCVASLGCDYSLYRMCLLYGQNYAVRLTIFASSYAALVFGSRTFSNTIEMLLLAVLLFLVLDSMHFSDQVIWREDLIIEKFDAAGREKPVERARLSRLRSSLPQHALRHCGSIAFISVAGTFNRPTFLAFAAPAIFSWLHRGMGSKSVGWYHFHLRLLTFCMYGLASAILFVLLDSIYYGYLTLAEVISFQISLETNFVMTPINFIRYNMKPSNLALHGIHPRWLHTVVNIPLLFNVLGITGMLGLVRLICLFIYRKWSYLPKAQSIIALMHASFLIPLVALSMFPHQEPRFLLPLIIPLTFLHAQTLRLHHRLLMPTWFILNALAVIFYGFLHQGGMWGLVQHLHESNIAHPPPLNSLHLVVSHTYPIPRFPFLLPSAYKVLVGAGGRRYRVTRRVHIHEVGSSKAMGLDWVEKILAQCSKDWDKHRLKCHVYSIFPGTMEHEFDMASLKRNISKAEPRIFYPHLSTEALPSLWGNTCDNSCLSASSYFTRKIQELGLMLVKVS